MWSWLSQLYFPAREGKIAGERGSLPKQPSLPIHTPRNALGKGTVFSATAEEFAGLRSSLDDTSRQRRLRQPTNGKLGAQPAWWAQDRGQTWHQTGQTLPPPPPPQRCPRLNFCTPPCASSRSRGGGLTDPPRTPKEGYIGLASGKAERGGAELKFGSAVSRATGTNREVPA